MKKWQNQTDSERTRDFGDYLYDFYSEMLQQKENI